VYCRHRSRSIRRLLDGTIEMTAGLRVARADHGGQPPVFVALQCAAESERDDRRLMLSFRGGKL